ncbi:MAG: type II toxin-antitoxin system VapC family toxin [Ilumatobacteraceae bacterium]
MAETFARGLIDTSVVIDLDGLDPDVLPNELAVSALTMAELAAGPHASDDAAERARRQDRLQRAEVMFDPLPLDANAARAYGRIYAAVTAAGRKARGPRVVDLLIAATALANDLPLYTRNPDDFRLLDGLVEVVTV